MTMAYLNVRERRIETKIAYIGPELAGKATNLQQLKSDSSRGRASDVLIEGDRLSLEWRPLQMDRFNDCDVAVKLVASKGAISEGRLPAVLDGVDGVVVVVDAAPASREESQRALKLVKEAVSRTTPSVPVVVQVNKSDLADALPDADVAGEVGWPVVRASAVRGEGVVETLEKALATVLDAMSSTKKTVQPEPGLASKLDQTPLLAALRDVLRETVTEHMTAVERQAADRIAASVAERFDDANRAVAELKMTIAVASKETARVLASQEAALIEISGRITELQAALVDVVTRAELTEQETRLKEDAALRAKAERDHVTSMGSVLKRSIEGLAAEARRLDHGDKYTKISAELVEVQSKIDGVAIALEPTTTAVQRLPNRLQAVETAIQRELREIVSAQLKRIEDSVQVMHVDTEESMQKTNKAAQDIQGGLNELLEELKKRKKGWFS
jgi:signal recognition particle receptor subunit beta/uncharacterized protein YoxC